MSQDEEDTGSAPLTIDYYTDILCIWAYIAQRRLDELELQFPGQLDIRHHCMNIFGNVPEKMQIQWRDRGGQAAFTEHVHEAAAAYSDTPLHPELWRSVQPRTSANAHLYLKGAELVAGRAVATDFTRRLREAFFCEAVDISLLPELDALASEDGLDRTAIRETFEDGRAMAELVSDYEQARQLNLRGSPSYIMNQERQVLYGNVGYRVLSANVEELLRRVDHEASWC